MPQDRIIDCRHNSSSRSVVASTMGTTYIFLPTVSFFLCFNY